MNWLDVGDEVRVDIPDKDDPDFERLHGRHGTVVEVLEDDAGFVTGDPRDSLLYRIELTKGDEAVDVRWRDLRPL
ncbi:hypothetical protein [Halostagnicola sp. A-GB9-2]|uniref:hypothetical protein n=1 Tax=Halostagnicola sp. A-GB9-2 TaxID=3048066 RepID=UPI0031F2E5B8